MDIKRRDFLKVAAAGGLMVAANAGTAHARDPKTRITGALGLLYDSTVCTGCKACVSACKQYNDMPPSFTSSDELWDNPLDTDSKTYNIIKLYKDGTGEVKDREKDGFAFMKRQCMHCLDPACASACMLGAMKKREHGIITYDPDLCIGCRYCQMACPFNVPKFEWSKVMPKMVKCEMCNHRIAKGQIPACCEVCPTGAVIFGEYTDLLAEAHRRIDKHPDRYVAKVYGETEVGGTQVLYLAGVDFAKLGLPAYGSDPVPTAVREVFQEIYQGIVPPIALYALLAAVMLRSRRQLTGEGEEDKP